jgi:hypothetical protein
VPQKRQISNNCQIIYVSSFSVIFIIQSAFSTMKSHEENRKRVCLLCFGKKRIMRQINTCQVSIIEKYFINNYKIDDVSLPCALCLTCQKVLSEYGRGISNRKIELLDYSKKNTFPRSMTRHNEDCQCDICKIGRSNAVCRNIPKRKKVGRPSFFGILKNKEKFRLCGQCCSKIGRRKQHVCKETVRNNNLVKMATECASSKSTEKIVSGLLKNQESSSSQSIYLSTRTSTGRRLSVSFIYKEKSTFFICRQCIED